MITRCFACTLAKDRKNIVNGVGTGKICLIGEAPGYYEDKTGTPFVGQSGKYLNLTLAEAGIVRDIDTYITNVCKCRPAGNRTPSETEAEICAYLYLQNEVKLLNPIVIVLLGTLAARTVTGDPSIMVSRRRGWYTDKTYITYHPSYIMRTNENKLDESYVKDFADIKYKYSLYT